MSIFICSFTSPDATLARAGGKGMNLAELARAGFPVPPGFVVMTDAYRAFVAAYQFKARLLALVKQVAPEDPVALENVSAEIGLLFERGPMPDEMARDIASAYETLSLAAAGSSRLPVAVRSSATAEDLPGLSFAGQQETYLNVVGTPAVLDAVKRCWASLWTARAIGYRARNHIPPEEVALAVAVQTMIASEASGVLFTANPLTGRRDEIVMDASFGLGEAIVSGQVEPDHYVVDPRTWRITERKLGAKALAILPRAGGGTEPVAQDNARRQALSDAHILELARLAHRVAEHYGSPQDIEWAWADQQLYLLQSRPITSLYPLPPRPPQADDLRVYFSFNSIQGVTDPFTPLGGDLLQTALGGLPALLRIRRPVREVIPAAGGRLFLDLTEAVRDPHLRKAVLAGLARGDPGARQALKPLIESGRFVSQPVGSPWQMLKRLISARPAFGRALAALRSPAKTSAGALAVIERFLAEVRQQASAAHDLPSRLAAAEQGMARFVERVLGTMIPVIFPALASMSIVDGWLVGWLGAKPGAVLSLLRGLAGNVTTEMDLKLWALAQTIRADAAARQVMLTRPVEELATAYDQHTLPATAQAGLEKFLGEYGMRAVAEIDLGRPRWRDDPTPILQTLHGYLRLEDPDLAPDVVFRRGAAESERLAATYVAQAQRQPFGALRAKLLGAAIRRMRALMALRETPKFYLVKMLDAYRTALLDSGRDLVARGDLERAEDIFFVPLDELKRFAGGEAMDLKAIIAAQRAEYERERGRRQMPRLLLSTGEAFYAGVSDLAAGPNDLAGDPVSPGVVEGRAHVVLDPRGVRLEPGEILVCPATDPGWTPLFLTAGGLVMEIGGLVTHGSVVAREYGIPAVVGVHAATARLKTGQRVRVDGNHGRVTLLEA